MWLRILLKIIVLKNYCTQIMQCGLVFHMQSIDHHTLVQSYLDMFRFWQKKIAIQSSIKKTPKKTPLKSLSQPSCCCEGQNKFLSNDTNQTPLVSMHNFSIWEHAQLVGYIMMAKKQKTKDKEADLLLFNQYHALTANKPLTCTLKLKKCCTSAIWPSTFTNTLTESV